MKNDQNSLLTQVYKLNDRVDRLETRLNKNEKIDSITKTELKNLKEDMEKLRIDILSTMKQFNNRLWKMISKGLSVLLFLIGVIVAFAGIKLTPTLLKAFIK